MRKVVIVPDSFKGTLSSARICSLISEKVKEHFPACETVLIPVADGGEGSVDCFLAALGGEKVAVQVKNPFFEEMKSFYGRLDGGRTAVIEMAACAGLPLVENRMDPCGATTYGVGQLMMDAARRGAKTIVVGLGGSATNDGGCGAAAALGIKFINARGEPFVPVGGTLREVAQIDLSGKNKALEGVEIIAMCDIDNPMYGPSGAAHVFGPQKGADPGMVRLLDEGIRSLAGIIQRDLGQDIAEIPGAGSAGAMGAGMMAFFGARLQRGIETVLDTVRFDEALAGADMVFTGEGRIDRQSLRGKVVAGVAGRAKRRGIPVVVIVGGAEDDVEEAYAMGVSAVFTINRLPEAFAISREKSAGNLALTMDNILRLIKTVETGKSQ